LQHVEPNVAILRAVTDVGIIAS